MGIYAEQIRLNLGCGDRHIKDFINIDNDHKLKPQPDMLHDIVRFGLHPWDTGSVAEVRAFDFLEHIPPDRVIYVINEIWRVLEPDGKFEHLTPSTDGRGAFQDPTHVSYWNRNSWFYYCPELVSGRRFYDIRARFKVHRLEDCFTDSHNNVIHTYGLMYADKTEQ